jgi:hypothetical protein
LNVGQPFPVWINVDELDLIDDPITAGEEAAT